MRTRARIWRISTGTLIALSLAVMSERAVFVFSSDGTSGAVGAGGNDTPTSSVFSEQNQKTAARDQKAEGLGETVTVTGGIEYAVQIHVPPGRVGHTPALALRYSSDDRAPVSPIAVGWSLPYSSIRRNTKHGMPALRTLSDGHLSYRMDAGSKPFSLDGVELDRDSDVTSNYFSVTGVDGTLSHFFEAEDYWRVQDRDGRTKFYGGVPDGSVSAAKLTDERGTREWSLVRDVDSFGNAIDYEYVKGPSRGTQSDLQLEPLIAKVRYGSNVNAGIDQFAEVDFQYSAPDNRRSINHARGHTYLDRRLDEVRVSLTRPTPMLVRRYVLTYQTSPWTARDLLESVREVAGALTMPPMVFTYGPGQDCGASPCPLFISVVPSAPTSGPTPTPQLPRFVARGYKVAASGNYVTRFFADRFDENFETRWCDTGNAPCPMGIPEFSSMFSSAISMFASPAGQPSAWKFQDLDGDGQTDLLYHPTAAAGAGWAQDWMSYLKRGSSWVNLRAAYPGSDPLALGAGATEYVDVDGDGVADRVKQMPNIIGDGGPGPATNPAMFGLCAFWFEHAGGYTDPLPPDFQTRAMAAALVNEVARDAHIGSLQWVRAMDGTIAALLAGAVRHASLAPERGVRNLLAKSTAGREYLFSALGGLQPGGVPGPLGYCYDLGPRNLLMEPRLPGLGGGAPGYFVIEHGRLRDPRAPADLVKSTLAHYPNIGSPRFHATNKDTTGAITSTLTRLEVQRTTYLPIVDMDLDGRPDIVAIKSWEPNQGTFGGGFWRIRDKQPIHEFDSPDNTSEFTASLDRIFLTRRRFTGNPLQDYQCRPTSPRNVRQALRTAVRAKLIQFQRLRLLEPHTIAEVQSFADTILTASGSPISKVFTAWTDLTAVGQRLHPNADWVAQLVDVNADGLPDLVIAKGATCITDSTHSDHQAGFDVYLNRGDSFDAVASPEFSGGPFEVLRNWNARGADLEKNLVDAERLPFSALTFEDLDEDGRADAIISAYAIVLPGQAYPPYFTTNDACMTQDAGMGKLLRCVWRGVGTGWRPSVEWAAKLPAIPLVEVVRNSQEFVALSTDGFRFADLDGDGRRDLLASKYPGDPDDRLYIKRTQPADLLNSIDNGLGGRVVITHDRLSPSEVNFNPTIDFENGRIPFIPTVVRSVRHISQSFDVTSMAQSEDDYVYANPRYDFAEQEFLGFRSVSISRGVRGPDGSARGIRMTTREYFQTEQTSPRFANPLRGLVRSEMVSATGSAPWSEKTEYAYELAAPDLAVNRRTIRKTSEDRTICSGDCNSHARREMRTYKDFDAHDNAQTETLTAEQVGAEFGSPLTQTTTRTFINDESVHILGLVAIETVSDPSGELSRETFTYDHTQVRSSTTARRGIEPLCSDIVPTFTRSWMRATDGNITLETNDNNVIVGGAASERTLDYDPETRSLLVQSSVKVTTQTGMVTHVDRSSYDRRFGVPTELTDPNGVTTKRTYDDLGRLLTEIGAEGEVVRTYSYNTASLPQSDTITEIPGFSQPSIERVRYNDGWGRLLQASIQTAAGAVIESRVEYGSLGTQEERWLPMDTASTAFETRSSLTSTGKPRARTTYDPMGRVVTETLADGRSIVRTYEIGRVTFTDALGTPRVQIADALGRTVAVEEQYQSWDKRAGPVRQRTTFVRDGRGDVTSVTDPSGNIRRFRYNEQHALTMVELAHSTTVDGAGEMRCHDGVGSLIKVVTAEGRETRLSRDEIGRVTRIFYPRSGEAVELTHDESTLSFGVGRLTSVRGSLARESLAYDMRGNVIERRLTLVLGSNASPFADTELVTTATFDRLGRPIGGSLPFSADLLTANLQTDVTYNERGVIRSIKAGDKVYVSVSSYSPGGSPTDVTYGNGVRETWNRDPLNERLTASSTINSAGGTIAALSYAYDANDNPTTVTRTWGDPFGSFEEQFKYDTLNRLERSVRVGGPNAGATEDYTFDPAGNLTSKAGAAYLYGGTNTQAPQSRTVGTRTEQYKYDLDGNMISASPRADGTAWIYEWDEAGRLTRATSSANAAMFGYEPETGARLFKHVGDASDLYWGSLELRGSAGAASGAVAGLYHLALGSMHIALALRRGADGKLSPDPTADRFYHLDRQRSTIAVTGPSGMAAPDVLGGVGGRLAFTPYGDTLLADAGIGAEKSRYMGKETDETRLAYFGSRYYDSDLGMWVSADPRSFDTPDLGINSGAAVANLYAFGDDNPILNIDLDGRQPRDPRELTGYLMALTSTIRDTNLPSDRAVTAAKIAAIGVAGVFFPVSTAVILGIHALEGFANAPTNEHAALHSRPSDAGQVLGLTLAAGGATFMRGAESAGLAGVARASAAAESGGIRLSQKGLDLVEQHLSQFGSSPDNAAMMQRLTDAFSAGRKVTGADANFYLHEASEATMMGRGLSYEVAHPAAIEKYGVHDFDLFHPDVIARFPSLFNNLWRSHWNLPPLPPSQ